MPGCHDVLRPGGGLRLAGIGALLSVSLLRPVWGEASGQAAGPPELQAVVVEKGPVVDGLLEDPCWQQASHVSGFLRMEKEGPEFERTEAWICQDARTIYVAFRCHDSRPEQIRALQRKRGGDIGRDDTVAVSLDVMHDHRTAYLFRLTARGTQNEDIPGGSAEKYEWRGDWRGAARIQGDGWGAELAVPFDILRYPNGQRTFGVHFSRYLARMSDSSCWPDLGRGHDAADLTRDANWVNVVAPEHRPPLILMPYAVSDIGGSEEETATGGLDAKYVVPNGLVTMLSYKPDFRNIEDVVESIDFTYTERQFPEYRPFFTEGGGKKTEWGEQAGSFYPPSMIFYSRRIPVVDAGAKAFGKLGRHSLGILDAVEPDRVNDLALAYGYDLGDRGKLRLGAVNHREPEGLDNLALHLGTEWGWPKPDGSSSFSANIYQGSTEGPRGDGRAFSLESGRWRPNGMGWWGWYQQVGRDFQNVEEQDESGTWLSPVGVGYVPETGIRGGGLWLDGHWSYDTGALQDRGWDCGGSLFDDPAGPRWEVSGGYHLGWRNDTSWGWGVGVGEREGFADKSLRLWREWHDRDLYRRGSFESTLGGRLGGPYRFFRLSQGYRPTRDFSWQVRLEKVSLSPDNPDDSLRGVQALVTATYDLSDERSISARLVYRKGNANFWLPQVYYEEERLPSALQEAPPEKQIGKINLYAAYRQRVAHGRDILLVLGDPNTPATEARVAIKMVWTHFLSGVGS